MAWPYIDVILSSLLTRHGAMQAQQTLAILSGYQCRHGSGKTPAKLVLLKTDSDNLLE